MRRAMTLAALAVLLAAPLATLAQTGSAPPVYFSVVDEGFSAAAWSAAGTNGSWFLLKDGERSVAYTAQLDKDGKPAGYADEAQTTLTSPATSLANLIVRSLDLTVRGSSRTEDKLTLQVSTNGGAWTDLVAFADRADEAAYRTVHIEDANVQGLGGKSVQFRLSFVSDAAGDSTGGPSAGNPPVCGQTPPPPDPEIPDPTTEVCTVDPDYVGWFIDSVKLNVRRTFSPPADTPVVTLPIEAGGSGTVTVILDTDAGKFLDLRFDETRFAGATGDVAAVQVQLSKSGEAGFALALARTGTLWNALLAVDEPDLVAGAWQVTFTAIRNSGSGTVSTRALSVTSSDGEAPVVTLAQTGVPVRLGPAGVLQVQVSDATLRRVTYQFPGLPNEVEMPFPYALSESSLPEGRTRVTLRAYDRAAHTSTLSLDVDRDTTLPAIVVGLPATFYANVPAPISVQVTERTAYTVRLEANGTAATAAGVGGDVTHLLSVTPNGTAPLLLRLSVVDTVGNRATFDTEVPVVPPIVDSRVSQLRVATPTPLFAQNPVRLVATVEQAIGVTSLPVTVSFTDGGFTQTMLVQLPRSPPQPVEWNATLAPGRHTILARVEAPAFANETNPDNQNATLDLEVFLGSVLDGSRTLVIRADARGLPKEAVVSGGTKTYPLELVNSGRGVVYRIDLGANRTVDWDPLAPIAPPPSTSSLTPSPTGGDKDAPFPGLVLSLLVVALAAFLQRRR